MRVQRAYRQLSQAEAANPLLAPAYSKKLGVKTIEVNQFNVWTRQISNGSYEHGRSVWGFCLIVIGITFCTDHGPLHRSAVIDVDIFGAYEALERALEFNSMSEHTYILLDDRATVLALQTGKTSSLELARTAHVSIVDVWSIGDKG